MAAGAGLAPSEAERMALDDLELYAKRVRGRQAHLVVGVGCAMAGGTAMDRWVTEFLGSED